MTNRNVFFTFFKSQIKRRLRDKKFLVWILITPLILMFFFNFVGGSHGIRINVAVLDNDDSSYSHAATGILKSQDQLDVKKVSSLQKGIDKIKSGKVDAILIIPDDFSEKWRKVSNSSNSDYESINFRVYYSENKEIQSTIEYVLKGVVNDINEWIEDGKSGQPVTLEKHTIETRSGSYMNLLIPSGIIIIVLQTSIFSSSNNSSKMYENGLVKRFKSSAYRSFIPINGMILSDSLFSTLSATIALISGLYFFDVSITVTRFLLLVPLIFISAIIFCFIGQIIGKFSTGQLSAQGLSSMVLFPMIFFSEAYLFSNLFSKVINDVYTLLPIGPTVKGLNALLFLDFQILEIINLFGQSIIWFIIFITIIFFSEDL